MIQFLKHRIWRLLFIVIAAFAATSAYSQEATHPPMGKFLNSALPSTAPTDWSVEPAFPNLTFEDPSFLIADPSANRFFIGDRSGQIYSFDNNPQASTKRLVLDISSQVAAIYDGGLYNMALHPEFGRAGSPNRGYIYVYYTYRRPYSTVPTTFQGVGYPGAFFDVYLRLSRFTIPDGSTQADPDSELAMINIRLFNGSHRGGGLLFGNDGFLYLSIGDQFRYRTAQNIATNFEGGVIRIDVDQRGGSISHPPRRKMGQHGGQPDEFSGVGYYIPNNNPWQNSEGAVFEEFWTLGHRNPYRMSIDRQSGNIWVGEPGESHWEEINLLMKGGNYQWPYKEGAADFLTEARPATVRGIEQPPVMEIPHGDANAVIGGFIYRGQKFPELIGKLLIGDWIQPNLWAMRYNEAAGQGQRELLTQFPAGNLVGFGEGPGGDIYLLKAPITFGNETQLFKLARHYTKDAPLLLSETGVFENLAPLTPARGLIPYDVNAPSWSDGALKSHWMAIPNDGTFDAASEQIKYSTQDNWRFPTGAVFVQHFEVPLNELNPNLTRRLETRLLVHSDDGNYYGLTYRWRPDGSEADLVTEAADETVTIRTTNGLRQQTWHYPSRSECLACHTETAGSVLGVNTRQLNRDVAQAHNGETVNQLKLLNQLGILSPPPDETELSTVLTLANIDDLSAPLEFRARSYLDANCSHCHQPGSNRAVFDARLNAPLSAQNLINAGLIDNLGLTEMLAISPQSPSKSMIYHRLNSIDPEVMMPPLVKNRIDEEGVHLIQDWIEDVTQPANLENLCLLSTARTSQSSTFLKGAASRACDDNNSGSWPDNSITLTRAEPNAWWQVDLGQVYDISHITLWGRVGCCPERLQHVYLFVSDTPFDSENLTTTRHQTEVSEFYLNSAPNPSTTIVVNRSGRYVRIQSAGVTNLSLAEVEIFGTP